MSWNLYNKQTELAILVSCFKYNTGWNKAKAAGGIFLLEFNEYTNKDA